MSWNSVVLTKEYFEKYETLRGVLKHFYFSGTSESDTEFHLLILPAKKKMCSSKCWNWCPETQQVHLQLARDATSVPSLRQASDAFRRSRKRAASVSNDADVQIIESKKEEEEAPQPPAAKKAPILPLTSSPKVSSVKQTLPPTTPTAAAASASASASPTVPLSVKKAKSSRPTMSPADKEAAMKRKAELAEEREQKKKEKEMQRLEREQQKKEREEKSKQVW